MRKYRLYKLSVHKSSQKLYRVKTLHLERSILHHCLRHFQSSFLHSHSLLEVRNSQGFFLFRAAQSFPIALVPFHSVVNAFTFHSVAVTWLNISNSPESGLIHLLLSLYIYIWEHFQCHSSVSFICCHSLQRQITPHPHILFYNPNLYGSGSHGYTWKTGRER